MSWTAYRLVLQLKTQMHIGRGKVGNLQRTRPYLTGRVLWGALTERLTRNANADSIGAEAYRDMGEQVRRYLPSTYFYVALAENGDYVPQWPWGEQAAQFDGRFLGSYASTALVYPRQSAAEGTLHEIEYLAPHTRDATAQPLFLVGYIFAHDNAPADWQDALNRLQIGGERGYGWGWVTPKAVDAVADSTSTLFAPFGLPGTRCSLAAARPQITLASGMHVLAHASHERVPLRGELEPIVGRAWSNAPGGTAGQRIAVQGVSFAPGAIVGGRATFEIGDYGIWETPEVIEPLQE